MVETGRQKTRQLPWYEGGVLIWYISYWQKLSWSIHHIVGQYFRYCTWLIFEWIFEYSAWSIFEYSTTVSRTVNVSSWPPATTTAPGPTLTLNGQCVKKSLVEQWVHDQMSSQNISSYRARVHDRRVERERLRSLRVWSGNNLGAETGF